MRLWPRPRDSPSDAMRIAISTGGGDAPGLNGVIRAVVLSAVRRGWEVIGVRNGYQGLLAPGDQLLMRLDRESVRGIAHLGGTILGTTNRGDPFNYPVEQNGQLVPMDLSGRLVQRVHELGIDALISLGGDGSMGLAMRLLERGVPRVIGVPKTIDNDLHGTDITFGFETAVATATDAIDKLHTTAASHQRVMVVELMGRYAGWIALHAGISGGADVVLIPEIAFDMAAVCEKIERRYSTGREFAIVVVAEGAAPKGGKMVFKGERGEFKEHALLGGLAEQVAKEIGARTGRETRSLVLGHLQRGGAPVTSDRLLATRLGCAATRCVEQSQVSGMVALVCGEVKLIPFAELPTGPRLVEPATSDIVRSGRELGMCFGDEPPGTFAL
jgi:ATP-dependent phosphofructokinase / diphosphate-dependent phosphofructokinase